MNNLNNYSNDQLQVIREAAYKVAEAQELLETVLLELNQVDAVAEIKAAHSDLEALGNGGSFEWMYKSL